MPFNLFSSPTGPETHESKVGIHFFVKFQLLSYARSSLIFEVQYNIKDINDIANIRNDVTSHNDMSKEHTLFHESLYGYTTKQPGWNKCMYMYMPYI